MNLIELGKELKKMYENAQSGDAVCMIHLFGVRYARQINQVDCTAKDIAEQAGIPMSYETEIRKGIKLSKYVSEK